VPTLLYSVLFEANTANASDDFQVNPFEDDNERSLRISIFDVLRSQVALEHSEDSTTVQSQLIYLISGGLRPSPTPTPSASPSPALSVLLERSFQSSSRPLSYANVPDALQSAFPSKRAASSIDLATEALRYLRELVAGSIRLTDRAVRILLLGSAAEEVVEEANVEGRNILVHCERSVELPGVLQGLHTGRKALR
jgi:hypothetical protein